MENRARARNISLLPLMGFALVLFARAIYQQIRFRQDSLERFSTELLAYGVMLAGGLVALKRPVPGLGLIGTGYLVEAIRKEVFHVREGGRVFDQDFLATFPSAILRVIVAGDEVVEARFLPVMIDDYRPVAVTGEVAERIVRLLDARSAAPAESERIEALQVGGVLLETQPPGTEPATVRFERNSGVVELDRRSEE